MLATNSNFLISISLQPNDENLWYFDTISKVYNIGLKRYRDSKVRVCVKDSFPSQKVFTHDENNFLQKQLQNGNHLLHSYKLVLHCLMQKVFLFSFELITDFRRELNAMGPTLLFHGVEISQEIWILNLEAWRIMSSSGCWMRPTPGS